MNIQERLEIFFQRLKAAPPANTAEEAMALVCRLIEEVEDEFCPLPRETPPPQLRFTGRMYAPQADRIRRLEGGQLVAATRRHRIYCQPGGAILIRVVHNNDIVLTKEGAKR
jgi:hypothetical protein